MKTVTQMAALTGISVRTLRYYDTIGLPPDGRLEQAPATMAAARRENSNMCVSGFLIG